MHLLAPLACGFAGAENGTADIYLRDTSTRAQVYDTFEGDGARTPTAGIPLDAHGGVTIYVYGLVDVTVRDVNGEVVRQYTDGYSGTNVELISTSFTGTDYDDGSSGASKPTNVTAALDRLITSFGALDGNVLVGGNSITLQQALLAVSGIFINVKAAPYGAKGDGATDDTAAIQGAVTAASTGGIVFFPPGTYIVQSGTITMTAYACLMGCGSSKSVIRRNHATNHLLTYATGTAGAGVFIRDIGLADSQASTGDLIHVTAAAVITVQQCYLGTSTLSQGALILTSHANADVTCYSCTFQCGNAAGATALTTIGPTMVVGGGTVLSTLQTRCHYLGDNVRILGHYYQCAANTAACEVVGVYATSEFYGNATVVGNHFTNPASGAAIAMNFTREGFHESGNTFGTNYGTAGGPKLYGAFSNIGGDATASSMDLGSRMTRKYFVATNAAATLPADQYAICEVKRSTNADQTLTLDGPNGAGKLLLLYWNNSGGDIATVTVATVYSTAASSFALATGLAIAIEYTAAYVNGSWKWILLATSIGKYTP